jgi:hypothetical protein
MNSARFSRLYVFAVTATWVTVVIGLMLINLRQIHEAQYAMATNDAREHVNEDNAFRFWVASMGGVYAPVTDRIQPNANLSHIPEGTGEIHQHPTEFQVPIYVGLYRRRDRPSGHSGRRSKYYSETFRQR